MKTFDKTASSGFSDWKEDVKCPKYPYISFFSFLFLFFSSFSFSFSFLFPFSLLIRSAFPSFPLLSPYPIGLSFLLSLLGGVQATTRAPTSVLSTGASGVYAAAGAPPASPSSAMDAASAMAVASARHRDPTWPRPRHTAVLRFGC